MAITTKSTGLLYGAVLIQHYDDTSDPIAQCGEVAFYNRLLTELHTNSLEYYDQGNGTNKFLRNVTLHIWAHDIPYDQSGNGQPFSETFWTFCDDNDRAHIYAHFLDYRQSPSMLYRFMASLSHEFGHAYHFWSGWPQNHTWGDVISDFWSNEVVGNQAYPPGWNRLEAYANAWRCLKGCDLTRGVSGPTIHGGSDPCPAPMQDPNNHPEWRKQFDLLPELCGYMARYGCATGSLAWSGGPGGSWAFTDLAGNRVALTRLGNGWEKWGWSWWPFGWGWQAFDPQYDRV